MIRGLENFAATEDIAVSNVNAAILLLHLFIIVVVFFISRETGLFKGFLGSVVNSNTSSSARRNDARVYFLKLILSILRYLCF